MLLGAVVFAAAAPAADLPVPQPDVSNFLGLPSGSGCPQATGVAVIAVHVNELGKPFVVQAAKSSGCDTLDRSGELAVKGWRFLPATRDGESIAEWTAVGFQYDGKAVIKVEVSPDTEIAQKDRNRVVCRVQKANTGSHIDPAPVCLSKAQWDERQRQIDEARRRVHVPVRIQTGGPASTSY
jgi:TonB family protein